MKPAPPRGRGSRLNPDSRFAAWRRDGFDDGWESSTDAADDTAAPPRGPATTLILDQA